jgi:hypothetical protein
MLSPVRQVIAGACAGKGKERLLFVNKKEQKNFMNLGRAGFTARGPNWQKVFAPLFPKSGHFLVSPV